ncbi:hypothetical protein B0I35DRAFT_451752 [Stachybotrys elegans]|uniref:Nephrocystin 3-like N-terminal domain-containing protein n=1 Tax=Stachybotrys elegans TaxID=80388 RepID=A0A8K0SQG4_9HYPO|nr:hypothetical protein B0I35DRAFT_451752 [Stachybotrys elegans]
MRRVLDTGISVVYEPSSGAPIVDIVVVHGLHGHPYKSWTKKRDDAERKRGGSAQSSLQPGETSETGSTAGQRLSESEPVFWPSDLLPKDVPGARVLTFGYDSKITKYLSGPTNQNSLLAHAKDLLFSLSRERIPDRPTIFVAHSLGGIVVKEALAQSSTSTDASLRNVVESTAAVIFLGTPHRGSLDLAALGEYVRSFVSTFRMETTPALLDALGLKTTDLERAQQAFSLAWQTYDFQVKSFQESLPMSKKGLGPLAAKVVPDYSSSIGDHRERAETLQGNHKEICRFSSHDDPNYRKVAGEIRTIYNSISKLDADKAYQQTLAQHARPVASEAPSIKQLKDLGGYDMSDAQLLALQSLWSPGLHARHQKINKPAANTCSWLFQHELYRNWLNEETRDENFGLLWIKGKPGTGKSVLMKEAFQQALRQRAGPDCLTAGFFFKSLWRSLLHQLLLKDRKSLEKFCTLFREKDLLWTHAANPGAVAWEKDQPKKVFVFIDALDECSAGTVRLQAWLWRDATIDAHKNGVHLNVCISSRHFPSITLRNCPEIIVEHHNQLDIANYVEHKLRVGITSEGRKWEQLRDCILRKSTGVFLWAVLVVDDILRKWDEGKEIQFLMKQVDIVPSALESLFAEMLSSLEPQAREFTQRLFQWAVLTTVPLRVYEWYHILAFIRHPPPSSLAEWRASDEFIENDEQLERVIRTASRGLLEVSREQTDDIRDQDPDAISILAKAGSLNLESGDTRVIQTIHESVREFFLSGKGFLALYDYVYSWPPPPDLIRYFIGKGHLSIMHTCLNYIHIKELDALVEARIHSTVAMKAMKEVDQVSNTAMYSENHPVVTNATGLSTFSNG